jgi:hypothetical protein
MESDAAFLERCRRQLAESRAFSANLPAGPSVKAPPAPPRPEVTALVGHDPAFN